MALKGCSKDKDLWQPDVDTIKQDLTGMYYPDTDVNIPWTRGVGNDGVCYAIRVRDGVRTQILDKNCDGKPDEVDYFPYKEGMCFRIAVVYRWDEKTKSFVKYNFLDNNELVMKIEYDKVGKAYNSIKLFADK